MSQESRLSIVIESNSAEQQAKSLAAVLEAVEKAGVRVTSASVKAGKAVSGAGSEFGKTGSKAKAGAKDVEGYSKSLDSVRSAARSLRGALAGTFVGLSIAGTIRKAITETRNFEQEQAQLQAVLLSTGNAAGFSRDQLNEMASAMSSASLMTAGEINQAQTTLLAFTGVVGDQFTDALQAAINMSARTGMSVVSAAETIGRALDIPSEGLTALSRQGFRFSEEQKKLAERLESTGRTAEAQEIILSALKESYGGAAAAARDTFGGSLVGLQNTLSDLMTGDEGSLDGAKRSVQQLTRTLESEETKRAFANFVSMVVGGTNSFANFMVTISEGNFWGWLMTSGGEAQNAEAEITKLEGSLSEMHRMLDAFKRAGDESILMKWWNADDVKILEAQISSVEAKLKNLRSVAAQNAVVVTSSPVALVDLTKPSSSGSGSSGGSGKKTELDEGERYIKQIRERISLIGTETEYERLLAQVSSGALKFRTEKMRELAEAEAKRLDAANASEEERKKSAELLKDADKRLADMQREIDLAGMLTEADKMRYEVTKGTYSALPEDMKKSLMLRSQELSLTHQQTELERVLADLRAQQSTTQLQFMRELESFGQGDRLRELNASLAQVEDRYRSLIEQRRNSAQGLSETELAEIQKSLQAELDMVRDFHAKKLEIAQNWRLGARDALINYADDAANVYASLGQTVSNAFKGMEDAMVQFATKGKLDFKSLADSIISDMVRIAIQQNVTGPLSGMLGGLLSAGLGALAGGGAVSGSSLPGIGGTAGGLLDNIKFSGGGYTGDGGKYEPAGIVHKGEGVLNQEEIRGIGGEAGFNALRRVLRTGHAFGGMGGKPSLPAAVFGGQQKQQPSIVINSTVNAAPGTNAAELDAMLEQRNAELRWQIYEDLRRGRVEI